MWVQAVACIKYFTHQKVPTFSNSLIIAKCNHSSSLGCLFLINDREQGHIFHWRCSLHRFVSVTHQDRINAIWRRLELRRCLFTRSSPDDQNDLRVTVDHHLAFSEVVEHVQTLRSRSIRRREKNEMRGGFKRIRHSKAL